ncbi:hypothetical protein LOTGIDRAFT_239462 [Lottia gigantea]|uniref:UDENN domain-containing protein n=1 Tax=Lottia gigantea TaxID=225164 RepID=V4C0I8_LOTGI|nr:hypothetical protein LOTGIDRAFT_239462 [Lottia gigantea]ESO94949.1 hypothetical protein LOTGIDRAFT_239462 [Lottia gigantea]
MASFCDLLSTGLIEKDESGDVLWTWSYPSVSSQQRDFFIHKSGLEKDSTHQVQFIYSRWQHSWFYILSTALDDVDTPLDKVNVVSLVLVTKDFNPERYETLCKLFSQLYIQTGNPAKILENYLSVMTRGVCVNGENGKFSLKEFDTKQAYGKSQVRTVIETFGVETILIYTALMLKKRIVVYGPAHSLIDLLAFTRALPSLVWHRQNWEILYPFLELRDEEINFIKSSSHYIAGFVEASVEGRNDLYDVFVNMSSGQITVAPQAKEALAMGKLHKDIAMVMVKSTEDDNNTNQDIIKEIANKTKELLNNLKSLCIEDEEHKSYITLESLRERKMPPATENFLFSLAACEGMVKL